MHLVCCVNEKVSTLLRQGNFHGTSIFVERVRRLWEILNIRSPGAAKSLNDPDRMKFTDVNDERLIFFVGNGNDV